MIRNVKPGHETAYSEPFYIMSDPRLHHARGLLHDVRAFPRDENLPLHHVMEALHDVRAFFHDEISSLHHVMDLVRDVMEAMHDVTSNARADAFLIFVLSSPSQPVRVPV